MAGEIKKMLWKATISDKHTGELGAGELGRAGLRRRSGILNRTHCLSSSSRRCSTADEGLWAGGEVGGCGGAGRSAAVLSVGTRVAAQERECVSRAANRGRWTVDGGEARIAGGGGRRKAVCALLERKGIRFGGR
jgi:hypothetical protein